MCDTLSNDYHPYEELGRGRFGIIHHICSPLTPSSFAGKSIVKHNLSSNPIDLCCLDVKPKILRMPNVRLPSACPNVIRLHDVYDNDDYLHLVTDFCVGGDHYDRLFSEPPAAVVVLTQLMVVVAFCHRAGVVHRDIKPDNILFDSQGRLKLADFGSRSFFFDPQLPLGSVFRPTWSSFRLSLRSSYLLFCLFLSHLTP